MSLDSQTEISKRSNRKQHCSVIHLSKIIRFNFQRVLLGECNLNPFISNIYYECYGQDELNMIMKQFFLWIDRSLGKKRKFVSPHLHQSPVWRQSYSFHIAPLLLSILTDRLLLYHARDHQLITKYFFSLLFNVRTLSFLICAFIQNLHFPASFPNRGSQ